MNRKSKNLQLRWNLSKRRCDSTPLDCVGVENAVKGRDERRKQRAALDSIFNAIPPFVFFRLDRSRRCHRQNDRRERVTLEKLRRYKCKVIASHDERRAGY